MEFLIQYRILLKMEEIFFDNYFIFELNKRLLIIFVVIMLIELIEFEIDEDVYNILYERRFKEMEENVYSYFVDCNDSVYCSMIN